MPRPILVLLWNSWHSFCTANSTISKKQKGVQSEPHEVEISIHAHSPPTQLSLYQKTINIHAMLYPLNSKNPTLPFFKNQKKNKGKYGRLCINFLMIYLCYAPYGLLKTGQVGRFIISVAKRERRQVSDIPVCVWGKDLRENR